MTPLPFNRDLLRPGDALLYKPGAWSLSGWIISLKTWHATAHCEGYLGDGYSVASRDGIGVGCYPFRDDKLSMVLRPNVPPFDLAKAQTWFWSVDGQKYDWMGLLRFGWRSEVRNDGDKMFCSEFLTRWYRRGGLDPFPREDADAVAPFEFKLSPVFSVVWSLVPIPEEQDLF